MTSCSEAEKKPVYTLNEIYSDDAYGFFVKDGDNFYPVQLLDDDYEKNFLWFCKDAAIPKVSEDTPLVAVYRSAEDMPEEYMIRKYNDLGYSVGANIKIGEDGNSLWMMTAEPCKGSQVEGAFSDVGLDLEVEIESINDIKPLSNVDTDVNIFTGLEKNKYYDFKIYTGTQFLEGSFCADTRVLKYIETTELIEPFKKTHDKYFIVNLPENLHKGFYDINGEGIFQR